MLKPFLRLVLFDTDLFDGFSIAVCVIMPSLSWDNV